MPMSFYIDENLSPGIAVRLRELGVEATHTYEYKRAGASDSSQLEIASGEGRCIVTADEMDFLELTRRFRVSGMPHAGVLIIRWPVRRTDVNTVADMIATFAEAYPEGMPPYTVAQLPRPTR
jgi:predicted nuclease of predicted toxin-antitoxin system